MLNRMLEGGGWSWRLPGDLSDSEFTSNTCDVPSLERAAWRHTQGADRTLTRPYLSRVRSSFAIE